MKLHCTLLAFYVALTIPVLSFADGPSASSVRLQTEETLNSTLSKCWSTVQSAKESVTAALEKKIDFAKSRGNLELLEATENQLDEFITREKLPDTIRTAVFERIKTNEQRKMILAYDAAISAYVKAGLIDDARLARENQAKLQRSIDLPKLAPFLGTQLLLNPGAEKLSPNGQLANWRTLSGTWGPRRGEPPPASGTAYFAAGSGPRGELFQLVDLREISEIVDEGRMQFTFNGKFRSYSARRADTAEAVIEFWNDRPETLLSSTTTGPVSSMREWEAKTLSGAIPVDARYIRVRLVSIRHDGKNNDGYFDELSLTLDAPE